jgi:phosphomannomutase
VLLPVALPTPVLAHAVRALPACAGVMVTASHNPRGDNGYKVYLGAELGGPGGAGAQLVPPADAEIEAAARVVGPLSRVALGPPGEVLGPDIVESYLSGAMAVLAAPSPAEAAARTGLVVAYTALHGVGSRLVHDAWCRAGFAAPVGVAEQAEPDPSFPTVEFPNPEEPGVMDRVLGLAARIGADVAIATDPDADRCAVAVRDPHSGWRTLHGDEVGILLADHLMRHGIQGRYAATVVSSSMLRALCAARGVAYAETLTGFKWIVRAGDESQDADTRLAYGYEEALGYCVAPTHVRDKDGITAALLVAELAAQLKAAGQHLTDRLDELARELGVYLTDQLSVRVKELTELATIMARLRARPLTSLLGRPVTTVVDQLPEADVLTFRSDTARVVVRPSGTEPKLKAYLETTEPVAVDRAREGDGQAEVTAARQRALAALAALRMEVATALQG